ncbi:hypothetical protein GCM10010156_47250 [Planobispora rosea]|uniref:Aminoglycoside phosphotransferase domain-containing protein n=1 Tax=Planobispora rosea TaxID=35762 RepID=A0A8J3S0S7_PLARO|nr:phosphotransferase [Planobispora rosea]GGS83124.1 hypothetical protein GCM10010156_47250 [Planobispora rosea]GIH84160.1 hypothetical protein Pro02_25680 [Planobispora rosea]
MRYPPGRGNVWIPVGDARSAAAGLSLLTFSRPLPLAAQRLLHTAALRVGPWVLPGRREPWSPPVAEHLWSAVLEQATAVAGPADGCAVYLRPQASRTGAAVLLLRAGRPVGFLKIREDADELDREAAVLELLDGGCGTGCRVPEMLGRGTAAGLSWMMISPMEPVPARPARDVRIDELTARIRERLADLPRPRDVPAHWEPMHGDLTPWNLRRTRGKVPWLIDWEDTGYGPPGADEVYYLATRAAVYGGTVAATGYGEAAAHWHAVVTRRRADDEELSERLLRALAVLGRPAAGSERSRGTREGRR